MNAPYDGDRSHRPHGGTPPPEDAYAHDPRAYDPRTSDPQAAGPNAQYQQDHQVYGPDAGHYTADPYGTQPPPQQAPSAPHGYGPRAQDPYGQAQDPYGQPQGPYGQAQDPYGQPAHAQGQPYGPPDPQQPTPYQQTGYGPDGQHPYRLYARPPGAPQQPAGQHAPDPRSWAPEPLPQPERTSQYFPYGDDPATVQFTGVDDLLTQAPWWQGRHASAQGPQGTQSTHSPPNQQGTAHGATPATGAPDSSVPTGSKPDPQDAFAHLFRDQYPQQSQVPHPHQQHWQHSPQGPQPGGHPGQQYPPQQAPQPGQQFATQQFVGPEHRHPASAPVPAGTAPPAHPGGGAPHSAPGSDGSAPRPSDRKSGGKAAGLLKSSTLMAAGTMVSRLTGFVRSALILVALGATMLGDSYQLAITLPTMIYILTVGGGLNSVFVPQLVRAMKEDEDGGEAYANRLLTLVAVILGALAALAVVCAPLLVRMMSVPIAGDPQANDIAVTFVRFCLPSIFFMGVHVVMGQILNARGRFGAMMWTPVLNNIVIIFTVCLFLWVYGTAGTSGLDENTIPPEGVTLLGVGTLLGLVTQALAMVPYLRATGFRVRPRFDWRGHGLGKAAKLAKWTVLFVLANHAGVLVVTQLSTKAGAIAIDDGHLGTNYIAYSNAQLIWTMPHAIITVSVMAALLPRLSRSANDGDTGSVREDISEGLRNAGVAIVPIAFGFVALGIPMCTFIYGSGGTAGAETMGYMLMAFGLGLVPYSVQYIVLRAFYAYEDTRTPFFNTVIVAAVNAAASGVCYLILPARWAVVGMAASYGLAYVIGVGVAWRRLRRKLDGDLDGARVVRTYARLGGASVPASLAAGATAYAVTMALGQQMIGSICALLGGGIVLAVVFVWVSKRMRIQEMTAMIGMVRSRLGR